MPLCDTTYEWFSEVPIKLKKLIRKISKIGIQTRKERQEPKDRIIEYIDKPKSDKTKAWIEKGDSLLSDHKYREAIGAYDRALIIEPNIVYAWLSKGYAQLHSHFNYEEAIEAFEQALQLEPDNIYACISKGKALFFSGRYVEALEAFEQALQFDPSNDHVWPYKGRTLYQLEKYDEAIKTFHQVLQIDPDNINAWISKSQALCHLGKYNKAVTALNQALQIDPGHVEAWIHKGRVQHQMGKTDEAIESFDKVVSIEPDNFSVWFIKGDSLHDLGRYREAIEAYDEVLDMGSDNTVTAVVWYCKGIALSDLGKENEAKKAFNKALQIEYYDHVYWSINFALNEAWELFDEQRKEVIHYSFETQMLKWECPSFSLPFVKVDFFVCPFLVLHFDKQMKDHYIYMLLNRKDQLTSNFQLFLAFILQALTTKYFDYLKTTNQTIQDDPIMGISAHALISEATSVWQKLTIEHPDLFKDENEQDFTLNIFEFIRDMDGEKPLLRGSCDIYPARPSVCRVHPLARMTVPDENGEYTSNPVTQKVILNQSFCPPSAFEQGEEITAAQYLEQQEVHFHEYTFLAHVNEALYQCREFLERLSEKDNSTYYKALINLLYFTVDYQADVKSFYRELQDKFDQFVLHIETVVNSLNAVYPKSFDYWKDEE